VVLEIIFSVIAQQIKVEGSAISVDHLNTTTKIVKSKNTISQTAFIAEKKDTSHESAPAIKRDCTEKEDPVLGVDL
jgi:hypothetical protein